VGLLLPVCATASQAGAGGEGASRAEERVARAEEREARRTARSEERAARRNTRRADDEAPGKGGETSETGEAGEAGTHPSGLPERGCHPSIEASSERITAGETVTVTGALECPTSADAADRQITVYRRQGGGVRAGDADASTITTVTTSADGSYQLTPVVLDTNTVFHVRAGARSAHTVVKVAPLVTLNVASPPAAQTAAARGHSQARALATFTGTVSPAQTGTYVALQVAYAASGDRWRTVAYGRVASDGSYSIARGFRIPGEASVRAVAHSRSPNMVGISEPVSYEAPQPQNPQLTIEASADPISDGQPVTISGLAAGAADQPVALLARTRGGAFAVVAQSAANASGEYTFTQEPLENTYYRVTDATAHSTTLYEEVAFALAAATPPSTAQVGQQLTFSGTLTPAPEGQVVYLERGYRNGGGFYVVGVGTVDAESGYQIAYTFPRAGAGVMRIRVPEDRQYEGTASAPFTITVAGAPAT
jgi:hypothetical protein